MATVTIVRKRKLRTGELSVRFYIYYGSVDGQPVEKFETHRVADLSAARDKQSALQQDAAATGPPSRTDIASFADLMQRVYELPAHPRRRGRKPKAWTPAGKSRVTSAINCYLDPANTWLERPEGDEARRKEWIAYLNPPGPKRFDRLDTVWWDGFFGRVERRKFRGGGSMGGSVNRLAAIAHAAYEQAIRWGLTAKNPIDNCTLPDATRGLVRPPTDDELGALLDHIGRVDRPFYTWLYLTADLGERRGEGCAFKVGDLDLERDPGTIGIGGRLSIGEDGPVYLEHTKANDQPTPRRSLSPETVALLKEHLEWLRAKLAKLDLILGPESWLFPRIFDHGRGWSDALTPWRPDYVTKRFNKLRDDTGVSKAITPHKIRHYVAKEMISAGISYETVANRLGNTPATIKTNYSHFSTQEDEKAVAIHGKKLAGLTKPKLKVVGQSSSSSAPGT